MSLIVDINPVPWRILDLVRARILRNRAKKAKKGMNWSKETLKREMSLHPGPLSRKRKDEPSFVESRRFVTYTIEGLRRYYSFQSYRGSEKKYTETWTIYVDWEGRKKKTSEEQNQPILRLTFYNFLRDPRDPLYSDYQGPNVDTIYLSRFENLETGDEGLPLIVTSTARTSDITASPPFLGREARAFSIKPPFGLDDFPETDYERFNDKSGLSIFQVADEYYHPSIVFGYQAAIMSTRHNPLQAWTLESPNNPNSGSFQYLRAATTASNPLQNEYDISKLIDAPGYVDTHSLSFPSESCPTGFTDSGIVYEMNITQPIYAGGNPLVITASPLTYLIETVAAPQVTGGTNWSVTWIDPNGLQQTFARDSGGFQPDSFFSSKGFTPPYVVLDYVKQIGTIRDCKISKIIDP
jgi:hypothetical protein